MADEPIPTKVEVQQITATDRTINFSVREEVGSPICKLPPGQNLSDDWDPETSQVLDEDGIQPGDEILVPWFSGYAKATVYAGGDGRLHARGKHNGYSLEYADRIGGEYKCWVMVGAYNIEALKHLKLWGKNGHHPDTNPEGRALLNRAADEHLLEILDEMESGE